ncbi:hypothetical protein HHI36_009085 [Cryptolaemus montrouzieri]|uniref:SH3 domain-containing protein n=1 Tax=Cryptolaemus montrouzieri TaxID=559131 RepID=A0ABD2MUF4_9CUCU
MSVWQTVPEERSFGIVIYNFQGDDDFKLKLTVGDAVHLLQEEENWYSGYVISQRHLQGIFPKSYIHVKSCIVDLNGPLPIFISKEPPIAQEITTVLREWNSHWKNVYVAQ